jgi:hypothetical protein
VLPGLSGAPRIEGRVVYNNETTDLAVRLAPIDQIMAGDDFAVEVSLDSRLLTLRYAGNIRQPPTPGADGTLEVKLDSVPELAAWLGQPLPESQPDPGPLSLKLVFSADGNTPQAVLEELIIEGEGLRARATGMVDASGPVPVLVLDIEGDEVDIDRYLPPPVPEAFADAPSVEDAAPAGDMLAGVPEEPFDLTPLHAVEAQIRIRLGGIKASGFAAGPIDFALGLHQGILTANLQELGLYGGGVSAQVVLRDAGEALDLSGQVRFDGIALGELAMAATGEVALTATASGSVQGQATGANPRALVESLIANLTLGLRDVELPGAPIGPIPEIDVKLSVPGLSYGPVLDASILYNGERTTIAAMLPPLDQVAAGDAFDLDASIESRLISLHYAGTVRQQPTPAIDGALELDIASVPDLAAWLDQPLEGLPTDPGPISVRARFAADAGAMTFDLEEVVIESAGITVRASGGFDGGGDVPKVTLDLQGDIIDLDRFLPPPQEEMGEPAEPYQPLFPDEDDVSARDAPPGDILAALSEAPLDLSPLRAVEADVRIRVREVKAAGLAAGPIDLRLGLKDGVANAEVTELGLYQGGFSGTLMLDGSGAALGLETALRFDGLAVGELARAVTGEAPLEAVASGGFSLRALGVSPRALAESLSGELELGLRDVALRDAAFGPVTSVDLALSLPGLAERPRLDASIVYNAEKTDIALILAPLDRVLADDAFAVDASVVSRLLNVRYTGDVRLRPLPGLDGGLEADVTSVAELMT